MLLRPVFPGAQAYRDPEPWGKALSFSTGLHACLLLFLLFAVRRKVEVQTVLTDVNFIEVPVKAVPAEKTVEGATSQGAVTKKPGSGTLIGSTSKQGYVRSHPELSNKNVISSERGSEKGEAVVSGPMTGPIVSLDNFGAVGKKKGSLLPYAAQTEGRVGRGPSLPPGLDGPANTKTIVLAKEDLSSIRQAESSLGTPLISQRVVADSASGGGRIHQLASSGFGEKRKASAENLKANPYEKDNWGNKKGPFSMEGPLKYRKIIKMELPPYPRWAEEKGIEASVSFRLWVNPKGHVLENMYLEKTSGYKDLDYLAKDALMKFIFVPIPSDQTQEDEWGVATFRFELKK